MSKNLSNTALSIQTSGIGYRNDFLFSGEDYYLTHVLEYELNELGNQDILHYTQTKSIQEILTYVDLKLPNHDELFAYWFTSKKGVIDLYDGGFGEPITEFELPNKYIILSDLDEDGLMIVSETPKSALNQTITKNP